MIKTRHTAGKRLAESTIYGHKGSNVEESAFGNVEKQRRPQKNCNPLTTEKGGERDAYNRIIVSCLALQYATNGELCKEIPLSLYQSNNRLLKNPLMTLPPPSCCSTTLLSNDKII